MASMIAIVVIDNTMKKSKYLCSTIVLEIIRILLFTGKMKNDRSWGEEMEDYRCWWVLLSRLSLELELFLILSLLS